MMTTKEASQKWCPMTNVRPVDGNWVESVFCCIGPECACWVKHRSVNDMGMCGLANRPEVKV